MNERVTMWSSQTPEVLDIIRRDGVSTVKRAYIRKKYGETAWIFLEAYDFMNGALRRKVPQPEGAESPVWMFRDPSRASMDASSVLLELSVPADQMICFDLREWQKILGLSFLGSREETEAFQRKLKRFGIREVSDVFGSGFYPSLRREVINSWQNLFSDTAIYEEYIQGAAWCIRKEWIISVTEGGQTNE